MGLAGFRAAASHREVRGWFTTPNNLQVFIRWLELDKNKKNPLMNKVGGRQNNFCVN